MKDTTVNELVHRKDTPVNELHRKDTPMNWLQRKVDYTIKKINPNPSTCLPEHSIPLEKQRSERDKGVRETEERERQRSVRDR